MGEEIACEVRRGRRRFTAKVLLETDELIVRGPEGFRLPFSPIADLEIENGILRLHTASGTTGLVLGARAARWQEKIRSPKGLLDKLGVKRGMRARLVGAFPDGYRADLSLREVAFATGKCDLIFLAAEERRVLARLSKLKGRLLPNGALWVVRPKGSAAITERDVFAAAKEAGLVDIKVVRFSETHSAAKLVIPAKDRPL